MEDRERCHCGVLLLAGPFGQRVHTRSLRAVVEREVAEASVRVRASRCRDAPSSFRELRVLDIPFRDILHGGGVAAITSKEVARADEHSAPRRRIAMLLRRRIRPAAGDHQKGGPLPNAHPEQVYRAWPLTVTDAVARFDATAPKSPPQNRGSKKGGSTLESPKITSVLALSRAST